MLLVLVNQKTSCNKQSLRKWKHPHYSYNTSNQTIPVSEMDGWPWEYVARTYTLTHRDSGSPAGLHWVRPHIQPSHALDTYYVLWNVHILPWNHGLEHSHNLNGVAAPNLTPSLKNSPPRAKFGLLLWAKELPFISCCRLHMHIHTYVCTPALADHVYTVQVEYDLPIQTEQAPSLIQLKVCEAHVCTDHKKTTITSTQHAHFPHRKLEKGDSIIVKVSSYSVSV